VKAGNYAGQSLAAALPFGALARVSVSLGEAATGIDDRNVGLLVKVFLSFRVSRGCDLRHRVADTVVDEMPTA
jgi:hypothetical protein